MKFFAPIFLIFSHNFAMAESSKIGADVADEVIRKIDAEKITDGIYTPSAFQFIKKDQSAPTCSLVDKNNSNTILEIMPPEEMEYPNCNKIWKPIIAKIGNDYFAAYRYDVEDPKKVFTASFQLIRITKDGFYKCKEDDSISERLQKKKAKTEAAIKDVIKVTGCTTAPL
jgi:hypothetical protein